MFLVDYHPIFYADLVIISTTILYNLNINLT